jgi:hypothetical protein
MPFFVQVYRGLKSCTSLLENVSLRIPPNNLRELSLFCACSSNKHCSSARCVYAASVAVGKALDIFALGVISLNCSNVLIQDRIYYYHYYYYYYYYYILIIINVIQLLELL